MVRGRPSAVLARATRASIHTSHTSGLTPFNTREGWVVPERETPPVRQRLIDAALECLATQESHSVSVRTITKAAGVTPGLLRYYLASSQGL